MAFSPKAFFGAIREDAQQRNWLYVAIRIAGTAITLLIFLAAGKTAWDALLGSEHEQNSSINYGIAQNGTGNTATQYNFATNHKWYPER
jgi:hypothetical protein